jgi:hypothetical protein
MFGWYWKSYIILLNNVKILLKGNELFEIQTKFRNIFC